MLISLEQARMLASLMKHVEDATAHEHKYEHDCGACHRFRCEHACLNYNRLSLASVFVFSWYALLLISIIVSLSSIRMFHL